LGEREWCRARGILPNCEKSREFATRGEIAASVVKKTYQECITGVISSQQWLATDSRRCLNRAIGMKVSVTCKGNLEDRGIEKYTTKSQKLGGRDSGRASGNV